MKRQVFLFVIVAALAILFAAPAQCAGSLSDIVMTPSTPASLAHSEYVIVDMDYVHDEAGGAYIFVMPYTAGSPTPNIIVSGSTLLTAGSGSFSKQFRVHTSEVIIDQVKVWMTNADQSDTLDHHSFSVEYLYSSHAISNIVLTPASPADLEFNAFVYISFDYETDDPSGVRIDPRPISASNDIAIVCTTDSSWAHDYAVLLRDDSFAATLVEMADVASTDFSPYSMILIDSRTGYGYDWGDPASVASIQTSDRPIIGLGTGGASLFEELGLSINWGNSWMTADTTATTAPNTEIHVVDSSMAIFKTPNEITIPADSNLQIYTKSGHVGENFPNLADSVICIGREPTDANHYSFLQEGVKYWLWGFTASPGNMTEAGKDLFVNLVSSIVGPGSVTPNFSASVSPDYPTGSGSGDGYFTITTDPATVNFIRFQMSNISADSIVLEFFVPVLYTFSSAVNAEGDGDPIKPSLCELRQNYPNPFNPSTTFEYTLRENTHVTLSVFNVLGQRVRTVVDEPKSLGTHTAFWDGRDSGGEDVPAGVYFYRIQAGDYTESRKMLLLK